MQGYEKTVWFSTEDNRITACVTCCIKVSHPSVPPQHASKPVVNATN